MEVGSAALHRDKFVHDASFPHKSLCNLVNGSGERGGGIVPLTAAESGEDRKRGTLLVRLTH